MSNIFYINQHVGCLMFGEGVILEMDSKTVCVRFDGGTEEFYHNGRYMNHLRPTLYPIDQYRAIIANIPAPQPEAWKPKPGEWCWFWHLESEKFAILDKFKRMDGYNYMNVSDYTYKHCAPFTGELPDHLKEVKP